VLSCSVLATIIAVIYFVTEGEDASIDWFVFVGLSVVLKNEVSFLISNIVHIIKMELFFPNTVHI
jgi:hypothetical protein